MPYIDVDKLCELVEYSKYNNPHSGELRFNHRTEHDHFFKMIMSVPIEDVAKVVHGRWKRTPVSGRLYCGVCDKLPEHQEETNYCPNCGAKMDKEEIKND